MGSFANSMHVKCNDETKVASALREAMCDAGYQPMTQECDTNGRMGASSSIRAFYLTEAHQDWVGVLDSDGPTSSSLAGDLSKRLNTYSIHFFVNDSDSWRYQLFHQGAACDSFISVEDVGELTGVDALSPQGDPASLGGAPPRSDEEIVEQLQKIQRTIQEDDVPDAIKEVERRMKEGTATNDDYQQFVKYGQYQASRLASEICQSIPEFAPWIMGSGAPKRDVKKHVRMLRPILAEGATTRRLSAVLRKQADFAEEMLGQFMDLVGIQELFSLLNYRYLAEHGRVSLLKAEIKVCKHVRFRTAADHAVHE